MTQYRGLQSTAVHPDAASTREIFFASGPNEHEDGLNYRCEVGIIDDNPRGHRYGTSWTFVGFQVDELSDVASFGQLFVAAKAVKECRPNPNLTLRHEDNVPHDLYYRRDNVRVAGRVIPPPNWRDHVTLASASYNGAVRRRRKPSMGTPQNVGLVSRPILPTRRSQCCYTGTAFGADDDEN